MIVSPREPIKITGKKHRTEDYPRIDIRHWSRENLLIPGYSFNCCWPQKGREFSPSINVRIEEGGALLAYKHRSAGSAWVDENYAITIDWTPCHFGGSRAWFLCPAPLCGRRVAILYGGAIFSCRQCLRLTYASQLNHLRDPTSSKADKIRRKLGWMPGVFNVTDGKPRGMRQRTYKRLIAEHNRLYEIAVEEVESLIVQLEAERKTE